MFFNHKLKEPGRNGLVFQLYVHLSKDKSRENTVHELLSGKLKW